MAWMQTNGRVSRFARKAGLEINKTPDKWKGGGHQKFARVRFIF